MSKPLESKLSKISEENDLPVNEEAAESNEVHDYAKFPELNDATEYEDIPAEECFAQNEGVIKYVNAASHGSRALRPRTC